MRAAIAGAVVGDEQKREDPTVNDLEGRAAALLGQEAALFLPTATMANQIALQHPHRTGDELLAEENSHVFISELGGPAVHSGVVTRGLPGAAGRFSVEQVRAAYRVPAIHSPRTRVVWVENTHNSDGGRVWPLEEIDELRSLCDELGLRFHLDGARLLNAAVGSGVPRRSAGASTRSRSASRRGSAARSARSSRAPGEVMRNARRLKHLFGGAMRQAGIVAAAGVYALDHHVERLAEDHARAKRLARGARRGRARRRRRRVETNFVQLDVAPLSKAEAIARLAEHGVGLSGTIHPTVLRAVTHLDVSDEDIERAIELIPSALGVLVRA